MLNVTRLRVLAAVAAEGSVTAAARALHYAQPSVTHHLARLEAETGTRLLQRAGRGVRLTAAGALLAQRATEILGRLDAAEAELTALAGLESGRVRVAAFQSALSVLIPPAAADLRRRHPGLDLHLHEAHPSVAAQQLRDGTVDVAVLHHDDPARPDDGLRHVSLLDDPMFLLSLTPDDSLDHHRDTPWIAGCPRCRAEIVHLCQAAGYTPAIAYSSDDIITNQALVAAGLGVTIMPGLALRALHTDRIQASRLAPQRHITIATYGEPPDPPATAAFIAALRSSVQQRGEPYSPHVMKPCMNG